MLLSIQYSCMVEVIVNQLGRGQDSCSSKDFKQPQGGAKWLLTGYLTQSQEHTRKLLENEDHLPKREIDPNCKSLFSKHKQDSVISKGGSQCCFPGNQRFPGQRKVCTVYSGHLEITPWRVWAYVLLTWSPFLLNL